MPFSSKIVLTLGILGVLIGTLGIRLAADLSWIRFFDNLHWTSGTAAAAILAWLSLKRATLADAKSVFWFALGLSGYAVGQIFWDIQTAIAYANFPAPSDLFYLWLGPCIIVGLLLEIRNHTAAVERKTIWLDALTLTVAMLTLILALYLPKRGETELLPLLILIAYPSTLFGAASLALTMMPALRQGLSSSLLLFLIGLITTGLSWMRWNFMALDGTAIDGAWFNISFSVAVLLIGFSLTRWDIKANTDPNWDRLCEGVLRLFPLLTVVMAALAVVFSHTLSHLPTIVQMAADIGSVIVVGLAMIRQAALLKERDELLQAQSALMNSRRELALERGQLKSLVCAIPDLVWLKDPNGVYLSCNPRFEKLYGASESEIVGKSDYDFVDPELADFFRQHDRNAMEADRSCSNEEWLTFANGGYRGLFETIKTPMRDDSGTLIGVLGVARDITERKRLEVELKQTGEELRHYKDHLEETVQQRTEELLLARDAAETANKAKSVFLANMSHELRTPLNAILGFSNMMRKNTQLSPGQSESLYIINRSGEHLLKLINDVLEMAKIEADRLELTMAPFDLGAMVRDVTEMMQIRASEKGLWLKLDQSSEFPRHINSDEARLRQILTNLITNAIKFTDQGGITVRLGVLQNQRSNLLIDVEDTGVGIPVEDHKRIFEPFVQLGEHAINQGTGLGLTITRQFVQLLGGQITLNSTPGKGTLFRVELPVELADPNQVPHAKNRDAREVVGLAPGQPRYRILIVEDQRENQLLLSRLMSELGLDTKLAENGKQGIELFQSWQPDLIWMDKQMPVMDGIEAAKSIRRLPNGQKVKIVAVTASAFMEQQQEMLDAGMDDFVRKPYRFDEIYACLARQLQLEYAYTSQEVEKETPATDQLVTMLTSIPRELRRTLSQELISLNSTGIAEIIQQISGIDAELAKTLSQAAENFDYPAILQWLEESEQR